MRRPLGAATVDVVDPRQRERPAVLIPLSSSLRSETAEATA
jgi:hypothetical protein